jgi:hypothetical protein
MNNAQPHFSSLEEFLKSIKDKPFETAIGKTKSEFEAVQKLKDAIRRKHNTSAASVNPSFGQYFYGLKLLINAMEGNPDYQASSDEFSKALIQEALVQWEPTQSKAD